MKKQLLLFVMILLPMVASAHDIAVQNVNGVTIYYNYTNDGKELEVTYRGNSFSSYNEYTSKVVIPESANYNDVTYRVTSIAKDAFRGCNDLTSVIIPNSVTSIGELAFYGCTGLTSVAIGSGVTSISSSTFSGCSGLTSLTIPNSVTEIGNGAFRECTGLTSVTIPNSVTRIDQFAFYGCTGLASVAIGSGVMQIGGNAFDGADIPTIISLTKNPSGIGEKNRSYRTFTINTYNNATLYVPKGTITKYKEANGWKDFVLIEEGGTPPTPEKCEKPTICYVDGKLTFASSTEGATCYYSITDSDVKSGSGSEVQLGVTYNISVYATKPNYENSETATATLCWMDVEPKTEGITTSVAQIPARALLIKSNGSQLTVEGAADGENISVYTVDGLQSGSTISQNGAARIDTNLQAGSIAIVKIGNKSVKVVIK